MNRTLLLTAFIASTFALTACDRVFQRPADTSGETAVPADSTDVPATDEVELPVRPAMAASGTTIDWEGARRDLAARPLEEREGSFQVQSGGEAPPVPVFLPAGPVAAQSGDVAVRFQPTSDGYYAFFPTETYDIIVNGTNVVMAEPGAAPPSRTDAFNFQPTTTGAQVSFSRYGADYLVEFECKELVNGLPACITEDEAVAFARDLAISGTR
ncbi:hypothetical protein [Hyphomonas sp.]|jgi:hypothetical protein|uniref:hypothetical protein n=1 Tax=Hyphomonas sp. TaxID=87 RepID=UPI0025BFA4A2|nr:hypothetical protein [Hyphomonas sp.]